MKDATKSLEKVLDEISSGKPLIIQALIQEGGNARQYTIRHGFPKDPVPAVVESVEPEKKTK